IKSSALRRASPSATSSRYPTISSRSNRRLPKRLRRPGRRNSLRFAAWVFLAGLLPAQDQPAQYPRFLSNTYVGVQLGYIDYPFSSSQVQPGFQVQSIRVSHLAARVFLIGHEFNQYFSAQISDMRPVEWVEYR